MGVSLPTTKHLFAVSGNECAFPDCPNALIDLATSTVLGKICHIKASSKKGPRFDAKQTPEQRHGFGNLMLPT